MKYLDMKKTMMIVVAVCMTRPAFSAGTTGAEFLLSEVPAQAASLAAGTARWGGSESMTWNPAGIMGGNHHAIAITHYTSFGDTAYEQIEGMVAGVMGGNISAKVLYASTYAFSEVDAYGKTIGEVDNHDFLLQAGYAVMVNDSMAAGIAVKALESVLVGYTSRGVAIDMGVTLQIPRTNLKIGLSVLNMGYLTGFTDQAEDMPMVGKAGLGYTWHPGRTHVLGFYTDVNRPFSGDEQTSATMGVEYRWQNNFMLRAGYRPADVLGGLSLGMGFNISGVGFCYAYQPMEDLGANHRFTMEYLFGRPSGE